MPGAARAYGLEVSYWVDGRRDPERAADAAARYLKDLYVRFGSWYLVFAAYNAGYGAVLRVDHQLQHQRLLGAVPATSRGCPGSRASTCRRSWRPRSSATTRRRSASRDVTPDPPFAYEEVEVPAGTTLATVARAAGAKTEVVEALNPHLLREPHAARARDGARARAGRAPPPSTPRTSTRRARTGRQASTRWCCASARRWTTSRGRAACAVRELRRLNGVKDSAELRAGHGDRRAASGRRCATRRARTRPTRRRDKDDDDAPTTPASEAAAADDDTVLVAVPDRVVQLRRAASACSTATRDGDSLDEIADAFGVRTDELCEWNNLDPGRQAAPADGAAGLRAQGLRSRRA